MFSVKHLFPSTPTESDPMTTPAQQLRIEALKHAKDCFDFYPKNKKDLPSIWEVLDAAELMYEFITDVPHVEKLHAEFAAARDVKKEPKKTAKKTKK